MGAPQEQQSTALDVNLFIYFYSSIEEEQSNKKNYVFGLRPFICIFFLALHFHLDICFFNHFCHPDPVMIYELYLLDIYCLFYSTLFYIPLNLLVLLYVQVILLVVIRDCCFCSTDGGVGCTVVAAAVVGLQLLEKWLLWCPLFCRPSPGCSNRFSSLL